jgi:short-subunit dehydrogenase
VYAATKAYVTNFSLALSAELAKSGVLVLAVCPGPTKTEFNEVNDVRPAMDDDRLYLTAAECVSTALRALDRRRWLVVTGWLNRLAAFIARRAPLRIVTAATGWLLRRDTGRALAPKI